MRHILFVMYKVTSSNDSFVLPMLSSESENEKVYSFDVDNDFWINKHLKLHIIVSSNITNQNIKVCLVILMY